MPPGSQVLSAGTGMDTSQMVDVKVTPRRPQNQPTGPASQFDFNSATEKASLERLLLAQTMEYYIQSQHFQIFFIKFWKLFLKPL